MATPVTPLATSEQQSVLQKVLRLVLQLMNEKAHGQITITFRDGNVQLVNVQRAYVPKNLP